MTIDRARRKLDREYRRAVELEQTLYAFAMLLRHRELVAEKLMPSIIGNIETLADRPAGTPPAPIPECPICGWPRTIGRFHDPELPGAPLPHELPE